MSSLPQLCWEKGLRVPRWFPLFNAQFKLCKGQSVQFGQKGIPYLNSYDIQARIIKARDTIELDLENNNIIVKEAGKGEIKNMEKH